MTRGKLWTREELLLALNLYYKIPFGQFDQRNQKVIELANLIGRTPSSVAMQLNNFASLDPYHQNRGVSGLRSPGKLAQQLWTEAQNDWDNTILESEKILDTLPQPHPVFETVKKTTTKKVYKPPTEKPDGPTETERAVKVRLGQLHDKAFDRGFLAIDTSYTVAISSVVNHYLPQEGLDRGLVAYQNCEILLPDRFLPSKEFLEIYQREYFIK